MSLIPDKPFVLELSPRSANSICMIGSTRSGKSTALDYILKNYFKKHIGVLMTNSPQADVYKSMDIVQSPVYCPRIIEDMYKMNVATNNNYDFLAVLDDIVTGSKFDKTLLRALTIFRNSCIATIICVQSMILLNTASRGNINFVLLFKLNSEEAIERVIKAYLSSYFPRGMKALDKIRLYRELTEDHHFFVIDNLNGGVYRTRLNVGKE